MIRHDGYQAPTLPRPSMHQASLQRAGWGTRPSGAAVAVGSHAYATALAKNAHVSQSEELWVGLTYKFRNHPM